MPVAEASKSLQHPPQPLIDRLMSEKETAAYLGVRPNTLRKWRCIGRHELPFTFVGDLPRYRLSEVDKYLASRAVGVSLSA